MSGNSFGDIIRLTTFGESHGLALGCVIDGIPGNLQINYDDLCAMLTRRAPGLETFTSSRQEEDRPEILSGVFENKTLGTPIAVVVRNTNQKSQDYHWSAESYRVGHGDKTYLDKFGHRDPRGGGRSSGRETVARVIGGYFASLLLPQIKICSYITNLGPFHFNNQFTDQQNSLSSLGLADPTQEDRIRDFLNQAKSQGESWGGEILLKIFQPPQGLGEPVFKKLKSSFAQAMMSIPGALGVQVGLEDLSTKAGSELSLNRLNFGGMEGGISNGDPLILRIQFKAPSTVGAKAKEGRHDPCLLPRVRVVVEAMAMLVLADFFLWQKRNLASLGVS
jgi:chorismate synthase